MSAGHPPDPRRAGPSHGQVAQCHAGRLVTLPARNDAVDSPAQLATSEGVTRRLRRRGGELLRGPVVDGAGPGRAKVVITAVLRGVAWRGVARWV